MRLLYLVSLTISLAACIQIPQTSDNKKIIKEGDFEYLKEEPFVMPSGFPLIEGSKVMSNALKGTSVMFQTKVPKVEVCNYYRAKLGELGLSEATHLALLEERACQVVFYGWPNRKSLIIQVTDLAYSGTTDERVVAARLE